jgi:hypothetical protein
MHKLLLAALVSAAACGGADDPGNDNHDNGNNNDNGDGTALGVPGDFPSPASGQSSAARWAVDHSGYELIPNREVQSVSELAVSTGAASGGAVWDDRYGAYAITFRDAARDEVIVLYLPSQQPGTYEVTGFGGEVTWTRDTSFRYTSAIAGGRGTVEIVGNNGRALWGRFSGRHCFESTPGVNCFTIYEGRFGAAVAGGGRSLDVTIPAGFPPLSPRWSAHAGWRLDTSGYESVPNPSVGSVSDIPRSDGAETFGAIFDPSWQRCVVSFMDNTRDQRIELLLRTVQPGVYDLSGRDGTMEYYRDGSYHYISDIEGGEGTLEILGNDGEVLWGRFSGRVCFASTPDRNCFRIYEGTFSALHQVTGGCGTLGPPGGPG